MKSSHSHIIYSLTHSSLELTIKFMEETDLRNYLWKLHEWASSLPAMQNQTTSSYTSANSAALVTLKREYKQILDLPREQIIPLPWAKSPLDLPIPETTRSILGRSVTFKGRGENLNLDRIFVSSSEEVQNSNYI